MTPQIKQRIEQIRRGEVPEGYKKTNVGVVPSSWAAFLLGDIYTERKESGIPTLPILTVSIHSGVSDGALDDDELGKKVTRIEDKTQYRTARTGDVVFNMMRAWQGAIGVVRQDGLVSPAYIVATPNSIVYPPFMDYCLKAPQMINRLHRKSYGVTDFRLRLYWDSFAKVKCVLPPLPEQQKIAEILSAQDKLIALKEKLIEEKKRQKKYLMQQLLTGKKRLPGFSGDWICLRLRQVAERITRKNAIANNNVLTISAQYGLINQSEFFDKEIASEDKSNYYLLLQNEFAYNKSYSTNYPFGAIKKLTKYDMGIVSPLYICFRIVDNEVSTEYMEHYFKAGLMNSEIQSFAQEGARNHGLLNISVEDFFQSKIVIPPCDEQIAIAKILSSLVQEIDLLQQNLEQEKQKKKALMQLLLTGIVRV